MSTYTPIASQTLSSAAASVTFSSIPQGYTDLIIVTNVKSTSTENMSLRFNSDTGNNYSRTVLSGNGSTAVSDRQSSVSSIGTDYNGYFDGSNFNQAKIIQIMNYANSTTYKTCLIRSNRAQSGTDAIVGLWRNTNAITSITLGANSLNFASGSTFSLYGIQVGNAAQKAQGGNIVTSDGTYVYHTFTSSGSFTPSQALTVDYLVVAGGGGAGGYGGGGGAGGLRCTVGATGGGGSLESPLSLTAKSYPVIVGAGGTGGVYQSTTLGNNGSNSVFGSITATGGGGGNSYAAVQVNGATGGSGGGAGGTDPFTTSTGGAGTANQGYAGGSVSGGNPAGGNAGAGGGGAGAVGGSVTSSRTPGNGGNGVATSISGSSVTYAGGGAGGNNSGGTGGTGGGGGTDVAGTVNTGGGGGATNSGGNTGKSGGSGIVIIRYAL